MLYTIDLIETWSERLTYRIMKIAGASEETLSKYVQACIAKDEQAKTELSTLGNKGAFDWMLIIKLTLGVVALFVVLKIVKLIKSR